MNLQELEKYLKKYFPYLRFVAGGLTIFLFAGLYLQLFTRSCGGPFPYRTRGPLAAEENYKLGELPEWENALKIPGEDKTTIEMMFDGEEIPSLPFEDPPVEVDVSTKALIQSATAIEENQ